VQLVIKPTGVLISIYDDSFDYGAFGRPQIRRASHVEPDRQGHWSADLSPVDGPILGPFDKRQEAINAELEYLNMMLSADNADDADDVT